jgi:hypothetical protein
VAVGDFNGDGNADLATANGGDGSASVLLGNGDGTFQTARSFPAGMYPHSVAVGDFSGDGLLDLAVAGYGWVCDEYSCEPVDETVRVLLGNGDGSFQAARTFPAGRGPRSVAVGDVNGDGLPDLAVANIGTYPTYDGTVSVLLGNGDGSFQPARNFAAGNGPVSVAVGDFNGDGLLDLAVANNITNGTVSVLLGNGDGSFQAARNFAAGRSPDSVAVGDFNGDSLLDLGVVSLSGVRVLLGNGDGSFQTTHISYVAGMAPDALAAADFNGDSFPDLAVANYTSNDVSILLNDGVWASSPHGGPQPRRPLPRDDGALPGLLPGQPVFSAPESAPPTPAAGVAPRASGPAEPAVGSLDEVFAAAAGEQRSPAFSSRPRSQTPAWERERAWMDDWLAETGLILDGIGTIGKDD